MTWNCWSEWAASVKWKRPEEWERLRAAALDPKEKYSILPRDNSWHVRAIKAGITVSEHRDQEEARRMCQRMGWRYL